MTPPGLIRRTLTDFFRELLLKAMRAHDVEPSEYAQCYLVLLLERFAHPDWEWDTRPLALEYLESFHIPPPHRYARLKRVGDTALFLSGIFMENLERRIVSTDYYMSLGRVAYSHLAAFTAHTSVSADAVFAEMADRFPDFVRILAEISLADLFPEDSQTVRLYTRWLRTRSARDAEWLLRRGIVPVDPGGQSRH